MSLRAFSAGSGAMIGHIIRELGIVETVDNMVKWDPKQCKHSPGTHVLAMLINIFMGRTLDKILDAGPKKVFGAAAMRAALREDVEFDVVRSDTTSWAVKGLFESSSPDDQAFYVTHGYSRDHRPDLKQAGYGLVVNGEGIPLLGHALDGNEEEPRSYRRQEHEIHLQAACDICAGTAG